MDGGSKTVCLNIISIESNVLFPTIDDYDLHKPGDMALYLACRDFYP